MNKPTVWVVGLGLLALAGCSRDDDKSSAAPAAPNAMFDRLALGRGDELYHQYCAECHGPQAQGHPDWQTPNDGSFAAAPPLNGTGTEHQRTEAQLVAAIKNGISKNGEQVMPAWSGRLTDEQIRDIMQWFQSLWPPDVYEHWRASVSGETGRS